MAAGAWAVMAAYNRVNGTTMTENPLQRDVLKREWGFDGVIMSDWYATRSVAAAGEDLLDLAMPGPESPWTEWLLDAVRSGEISESAVDGHVLRLLRLAARVGALDGLDAATPPARRWSEEELQRRAAGKLGGRYGVDQERRRAAARGELAEAGRRDRPERSDGPNPGWRECDCLPVVRDLSTSRDYVQRWVMGSRSCTRLGVRSSDRTEIASKDLLQLPDGSEPGVEVIFLDAEDRELGRQQRQAASMMWWGPVQDGLTAGDIDHVQLATRLRVPEPGRYSVGTSGLGEFRLVIDGQVMFDETITLPPGADMVEGMMKPPQQLAVVELEAGRDVPVELTYRPTGGTTLGGAEVTMLTVQLNVAPVFDEQAEFERAVSLAAESDVAVVVVGTNEEVESEGFDRTSLALPGQQDELVSAVAAANPRTIVVVNSGAPVLLPWADDCGCCARVVVPWAGVRECAWGRTDRVGGAGRATAGDLAVLGGRAADGDAREW